MSASIALLGQPNSGKSTIYNNLTGARQHVGNWAGKTVEKNEGSYTYDGKKYFVTDLPGSYGLSGNSDEEIITTDYIKSGKSELTVVLVDASQLERSMFMLAEFARLDKPAMLVLNMIDVAGGMGKEIDTDALEKKLGIPVLPFNATDTKNYDRLKKLIAQELENPHKLAVAAPESGSDVKTDSKAKFDWVSGIIEGVTKTKSSVYKMSRFDSLMTRPVLGKLNAVFMNGNSLMEATFYAKTAAADTALLGGAMTAAISPAEALAFMFATTFNIPCLMALSTTYKESHSLKWTVKIALFYFCNALVLSCIVYHIAKIFM